MITDDFDPGVMDGLESEQALVIVLPELCRRLRAEADTAAIRPELAVLQRQHLMALIGRDESETFDRLDTRLQKQYSRLVTSAANATAQDLNQMSALIERGHDETFNEIYEKRVTHAVKLHRDDVQDPQTLQEIMLGVYAMAVPSAYDEWWVAQMMHESVNTADPVFQSRLMGVTMANRIGLMHGEYLLNRMLYLDHEEALAEAMKHRDPAIVEPKRSLDIGQMQNWMRRSAGMKPN